MTTPTDLYKEAIAVLASEAQVDEAQVRSLAKRVIEEYDAEQLAAMAAGLFDADGHVKLDEEYRIERGRMKLDHLRRRDRYIDRGGRTFTSLTVPETVRDQAYANEKKWIADRIAELEAEGRQ